MPPPSHSRAQNVLGWTTEELTLILLRQFKKLLAERGADWTDSQLKALAERVKNRAVNEGDAAVTAALRDLIAESITVLAGFGLTFAQALDTEMTDMAGWDTTADFLTVANEKVNAEVRISAGAALLVLLGDPTHANEALISAQRGAADPEDVDAVIALRALAFAAGVEERAKDRFKRIEEWIARIQ